MESLVPDMPRDGRVDRVELLRRSLLLLGAVQLPSIALIAGLGAAQGRLGIAVFAASAMYPFLLAPFAGLLGTSNAHAAWMLLAPASTTAMCAVTGGLASPVLPAFVLVPSMALATSRGQLIRLVGLASAGISFLAVAGNAGWLPPYDAVHPQLMALIAIVYATVVATLQLAAIQAVRAQSRRRLEAARDDAERAAHAREDFLAMMSHELRTPMSGILGSLQLLQNTELSPHQRDLTRHLEGAGVSLHRMLDDIIDFAIHQREGRVIELEPVDVATLVEDSLQLYASLARAKGLTLDLALAEDMPERVAVDGQRLRQVLVQLVANAVKYTAKGGVRLSAGWRSDVLTLQVEDDGPGIDETDLPRVFEPFVQLSTGTKRTYGGAGLGLATAKQLVEALGGAIDVVNKAPHGCRFTLQIPCPEVAPPTMEHPGMFRGHDRARHRVLIVDDTEVVREITRLALENVGYSVDAVSDGTTGVQAAATGDYSLVVMDLHMPLVDGFDAMRAIRALPYPLNQVPIIAVTADDLPEQHARALQAGADRVLTKPVDFGALGSTVDQFVDRR